MSPTRPIAAPRGPATFLTAARRAHELESLAGGAAVDVRVVGGGVTGAGAALDAATRGLTVALLERRDLANGTSRFSSKLVHGGLRYLASGEVGLAYQSARERDLLARVTAPHLTHAIAQLLPSFGRAPSKADLLLATGIRAGDALRATAGTSGRLLPRARRLSPSAARLLVPGVRAAGLRGALLAWDGQLEDDAALVVALARTAAAYGARILTRCEVQRITGSGAAVRDTLTGAPFELRARHVINATGVWAGELVDRVQLRPSRGSHLLVRAERLSHPRAMLLAPLAGHFGRFAFAVPRSDGLVLIGLTDEPFDGEQIPDEPEVPAGDQLFLLDAIATVLARPLSAADVVGRFAGLRPLLASGGATADLSRRHAVLEDPATGAVTVVGGKLTIYRRMAQDAVDAIAARPGVQAGACRTHRLQLVGAPTPGAPTRNDVPPRLRRRYGTEAHEIAALAAGRPHLLEPAVPGAGVLGVELLAAVQREGALSAADVLDRRTRLGLVPEWREAALAAAERACDGQLSGGRRPAQGRAASICAASE